MFIGCWDVPIVKVWLGLRFLKVVKLNCSINYVKQIIHTEEDSRHILCGLFYWLWYERLEWCQGRCLPQLDLLRFRDNISQWKFNETVRDLWYYYVYIALLLWTKKVYKYLKKPWYRLSTEGKFLLSFIYWTYFQRMQSGNFVLRYWQTNL